MKILFNVLVMISTLLSGCGQLEVVQKKVRRGESLCSYLSDDDYDYVKIEIINKRGERVQFFTETACSKNEKIVGLSKHDKLNHNAGMLFEYDREGNHSLTMRIISFPLDFIYLDKNWKVVGLIKNAPPHQKGNFGIEFISRFILALPAGAIDRNQIAVGNGASGLLY